MPQAFPFILANNSLQFLGGERLPRLRWLQSQTPPGGMNAISVMTRECVPAQDGLYLCKRNELKRLYRDWKLLSYLEETLWREPVNAYLSFAQIVAVRP